MKRKLKDIAAAVKPVSTHGSLEKMISGLSYDAFTVRPGELFLATEGVNSDRHQYIQSVLDRGITAVVHSKPLPAYKKGVTYIQVENVQRNMSPVSAVFFGHPSKELFVIGVTGTNGKSTTCSFIHQLLGLYSKKAGIISSVNRDTGTGIEDNAKHQSTPEAPVIHQALYEAVENGVEYMVLETTSHGLADRTNRVGDVEYDAAVMTNVSHEHLEFHGTMERYVEDKANLFRLMDRFGGKNSFGVVNNDDPYVRSFLAASQKPVYTYGIHNPADFRATHIETGKDSVSFSVRHANTEYSSTIAVPGVFNVSNALAASVTVTHALGVPPDDVLSKVASLK